MEDIHIRIQDLFTCLNNCEEYGKIGYVKKIIDTLLNYPESINIFYRNVLNLIDNDINIQMMIIKFIEISCSLNGSFIPDSIYLLLNIYPTCEDLVKSQIIDSFTKLYRYFHLTILNDIVSTYSSPSLYQKFNLLKNHIFLSINSESICVQKSIISFCQTLIICSCKPQDNSILLDFDIFNVTMIPPNHPILSNSFIKKDATSALDFLKNISKKQSSYSIIYYLLETARIIAISRPQYIFDSLSIIELIGHNIHNNQSSIFKVIKKQIRKLLKYFAFKIKNLSTDFTLKCRFILQDALRMTTSEIDKEMTRSIDHHKKSKSIKLESKKRKISSISPSKLNASVVEPDFTLFELNLLHPCLESPDLSNSVALQLTEKYLDDYLTSSIVADLVICGILMIPDEITSNYFENLSVEDHLVNFQTSRSSIIKLISSQLTNNNIGYGCEKVKEFIEIFSNKKKIKDEPALTEQSSPPPPAPPSSLPSNINDEAPPTVMDTKTLKSVIPSDEQPPYDLFTSTFNRILALQNKYLSYEDIRRIYNSFISSIIILDESDSIQVFVSHISSNLDENYDLLLSWFYKCWFIASESSDYSYRFKESYSIVFFSIINVYFSKIDLHHNEELVIKLILEVPHIPDDFLSNLYKICCETKTTNIGFKLLSDLILYQFKYSSTCLGLLLNLSISDSLSFKESAFDLILNIYKHENFQTQIEVFIEKCFEGIKTDESLIDNISKYIELLFHILTLNHNLLLFLFNLYLSYENNSNIQLKIIESITKTRLPIFYESKQLLEILNNFSESTTSLVLIYLQSLTTKNSFSPELIHLIKTVYNDKRKDARFLFIILKYLTKSELLEQLPTILIQSDELLKEIIISISQLLPDTSNQLLTPTELLIGIHQLEDNVEVKQLTKAIYICLNYKKIFTQEVIGVALQQLIDCTPIPALTIRTMIQALILWPKLVSFVMGLLQKLISKQVWKQTKLWHGFIKCCEVTKPHSFPILLQLPIRHLENAFEVSPELHSYLSQHVQNMSSNQRSIIQKAVLQILEKDFSKSSEFNYQLWPGDSLF